MVVSQLAAVLRRLGGRPLGGWVALLITLTACTFGDISLDGRECPCVEGWVCSSAGVCVRPSGTDAGLTRPDSAGIDASDAGGSVDPDAGPLDATVDATTEGGTGDGGTSDANTNDGGVPDSGPPDAGVLPSLCGSLLSDAVFAMVSNVQTCFLGVSIARAARWSNRAPRYSIVDAQRCAPSSLEAARTPTSFLRPSAAHRPEVCMPVATITCPPAAASTISCFSRQRGSAPLRYS